MVQPSTSKIKTPPKSRKTAQETQEPQSVTVDKVGYETPPQNSPTWLEFVRGLSLGEALAMAQAEMKNPHRSKEVEVRMKAGGTYKYSYAPFDELIDIVRPALNRYGIFMTQSESIRDDGKTMLSTIVRKGSESLILSATVLFTFTNDKDRGTHMSYQRRYQAMAAFGLAADDDTDGIDDSRPDYMAADKPKTDDAKAQAERDAYASWVDKKEEMAEKIIVAKSAGITAQEISGWVKTNIRKGQNEMTIPEMDKVISYLAREIKDAAPVLAAVDEEIDI